METMELIWIVIFLLLLCGVIGSWAGSQRGRSVAGFWLGVLAGPLGWIVVCLLPAVKQSARETVVREKSLIDPVDAWERSQAGPPIPRAGWRDRFEMDEPR